MCSLDIRIYAVGWAKNMPRLVHLQYEIVIKKFIDFDITLIIL